MVQTKIIYIDGSHRVINQSMEVIPKIGTRPTLREKLEGLAFDTGKPVSITAMIGAKEIFSSNYSVHQLRERTEIPTLVDGLDKHQLRRKYRRAGFPMNMYVKI